MRYSLSIFAVLSLLLPTAHAQRPHFTLDELLKTPEKLVPDVPETQWITGTDAVCIVQPDGDGRDAAVRQVPGRIDRSILFTVADLVAALGRAGVKVPKELPKKLPPFSFVSADTIRFEVAGALRHWKFTDPNGAATARVQLPKGAKEHAYAPGDARGACVVDGDVWTADADGTHRLTWDAKDGDLVYGEAAHRSEFGIKDGLWWGPEGRRLAFSREDMTPIALYPYADYDTLPAEPVHGRYPMAGRKDSIVTIGVHDTETGSLVYLENDPSADLYWTNVTFGPDGTRVYVALVNRGQDHMDLVEFDATTGKRLRTLFAESDPQWIEPEHGPIFLPDGSGFLWFSPRNGYRHLYRYAMDGALQWQETDGPFDVREFLGFAPGGKTAFVMASGEDPLSMHCWRVRLGEPAPVMTLNPPPPKLQRLTVEPGWHDCTLSADGGVLDHWSSLEVPGVVEAWNPEGERHRLSYARAPIARLAAGDHQLFEVTADDGSILHGDVILPPDPDQLLRYPVLLYVYGGPHSQLVRNTWDAGAGLWLHYMAQEGYVVIRLDNRGTDNRGIEFSQCIHRHLGELEVVDQLAAVNHVLEAFPFADRTKVGVHGWSFGGFMTLRLMLLAPDTFACGVAGAPVTDWRRYETGYGERYMDTPEENPDGYEASSVLPLVDRLKGDLLLVQGTDDKTVMFSNSIAFLNACVEKGVQLRYMAYPMQQHGLRGKSRAHFYRMLTAFFREHLPVPTPAPAAASAQH